MNAGLYKAALGCAAALLMFDGVRYRLERLAGSWSAGAWIALFAASRLALCSLAFVWWDFRLPGDVEGYYEGFAREVLQTGRTVESPYSPGFNYLLAVLLATFGSPLSFVFAATLAEVAAFAIVVRGLRAERPALATAVAALWLVNPMSLVHVTLGGQDEAFVLLAWALVAWASTSGLAGTAGILAGLGVLSTKLLGGFAALPLSQFPVRSVARPGLAFVGVLAVGGMGLVASGVPVLAFASESQLVSSGNLWALASITAGGLPTPAVWKQAVCLFAMAWAVAVTWEPAGGTSWHQHLRVSGTVGCLFLLLSPKSFTDYMVMFLPGLMVALLSLPGSVRNALVLTVVPVSTFEKSLWFHFQEGAALDSVWWARPAMIACDVVLVGGLAVLAGTGLRSQSLQEDEGNRSCSTSPTSVSC